MAVSYRIDVSGRGEARGSFNSGNIYGSKSSLRSRRASEDGSMVSNSNLKKVFSVGLAFNTLQKGNELIGAYTNNTLAKRKFDTGMTFAKYGIGLAINPLAGGVYMASDLGYRAISYGIKIQKKNREAEYYRQLSGNSSASGRRYRGGLV